MPRTIYPDKNGKITRNRFGTSKPYLPDKHNPLISDLSRQGRTGQQVAVALGISHAQWLDWCKENPECYLLWKKGRWEFDSTKVERSLLDRALGYEYDETVTEGIVLVAEDGKERWLVEVKESDGRGPQKSMRLVEGKKLRITHKHVAAEPTLLMFWLQNRQPEHWKNVQRQIVETHGLR